MDVGFRSKLCVFFGLDRSSVYRQRKQSAKDKLLAAQIRAVCLDHPGYGHRRIADELKLGKNRIRRVMKACAIPSPKRRKRKAGVSVKPNVPIDSPRIHTKAARDALFQIKESES